MQCVHTPLGISDTSQHPERCLNARGIHERWRFIPQSTAHGVRSHPHVPPTRCPRLDHLQFGGHQDAVIRTPAAALLGHTIF